MEAFLPHLLQLKASGREIVLCGDVNIAHKEIDIKNWKGNLKNSGFLPEERAWIGELFDNHGYVDVFRQLDPPRAVHVVEQPRPGLRQERRVAHRLPPDHREDRRHRQGCSIYKDEKFSDHAPLSIDYDFPL
jgi:exodeoxyribonuclease-3